MVLKIRLKDRSSTLEVKNLPKIYVKHCSYVNDSNFFTFYLFIYDVNITDWYKK
jgi:hypothetical protein